jgi:hypothetical protein
MYHQGRLSFKAIGRGTLFDRGLEKLEVKTGAIGLFNALAKGEPILIFDVPRSDIQKWRFPLIYFSAGVQLWIRDYKFKLSFIQPNAMRNFQRSEVSIGKSRQIGKKWREILAM